MSRGPLDAYKENVQTNTDDLIVQYLPLVKYVVGRLAVPLPSFLDKEDLVETGIFGLINAARTFDPSKGASFKTYAYTNIRGVIFDELRRLDVVPRRQRERLRELDAVRERLAGELGRPPSFGELAAALSITEGDLDDLLMLARSTQLLSLDAGDPEGGSLIDRLAASDLSDPVAAAEARELKVLLADAIGELPDQDRTVVILYFKEGLLLREIGEVIGVSESRVSQVLSRAVTLLNQALRVKTS
ncbi:MAG: FliA/WhiG family RNA polymerase sigma factor [Planctomycetota bacterium]